MSERMGLIDLVLLTFAVGILPAPAIVKAAVVVSLPGMF